MKKILLSVLFLVGMSLLFCSCERLEKENICDTMAGFWVEEYETYRDDVYYLLEFTKDGIMKLYVPHPVSFSSYDNGVLYTPAASKWEEESSGEFSVTDGIYYGPYFNGETIEVINNDTICFGGDENLLRVKTFSTK